MLVGSRRPRRSTHCQPVVTATAARTPDSKPGWQSDRSKTCRLCRYHTGMPGTLHAGLWEYAWLMVKCVSQQAPLSSCCSCGVCSAAVLRADMEILLPDQLLNTLFWCSLGNYHLWQKLLGPGHDAATAVATHCISVSASHHSLCGGPWPLPLPDALPWRVSGWLWVCESQSHP